jgi:hypothetical protein
MPHDEPRPSHPARHHRQGRQAPAGDPGHAKGLATLGPTKLIQNGILLSAQFPDGAKSVVRFTDPSDLAKWIQARVQHGKGKFAM